MHAVSMISSAVALELASVKAFLGHFPTLLKNQICFVGFYVPSAYLHFNFCKEKWEESWHTH